MDKFTIRNLELFQAAGQDGVPLINVIDKCSSPMGARLLRSWLAMPVMDVKELDSRYDVVQHFVEAGDDLDKVQSYLGDLGDLERIISRAAAGKILPREIIQLGRGLERMVPISEICKNHGVSVLDDMMAKMKNCSSLLEAIRNTLAAEPAAMLGKGEVIAQGVNSELDELRNISSGGKDYLLNLQKREAEKTGISSLKIGYNNVFGICCGILTGLFRLFGANAEGVSFAIILSNLLVPIIEKFTVPMAFGVKKEGKKNE